MQSAASRPKQSPRMSYPERAKWLCDFAAPISRAGRTPQSFSDWAIIAARLLPIVSRSLSNSSASWAFTAIQPRRIPRTCNIVCNRSAGSNRKCSQILLASTHASIRVFLYTQVPAFTAGDRGVVDLLGVTRSGRLAILELKANEDIHLVLQAADYWLRVRWHQQQDDIQRYGYFPGVELRPDPPLLFLVAPAIRFHPATTVILRHISNEIEVARVGLAENWRQRLRVAFRQ